MGFKSIELDATNIEAAHALDLKPGQEKFATPESHTLAQANFTDQSTWARVILDDNDVVVGSIYGNFDEAHPIPEYRSSLVQVTVSGEHQGRGIGRFAIEQLLTEAVARGFHTVTAIWERGDEGPEAFFLRLGFNIIGETQFGEAIGEISLN